MRAGETELIEPAVLIESHTKVINALQVGGQAQPIGGGGEDGEKRQTDIPALHVRVGGDALHIAVRHVHQSMLFLQLVNAPR